MTCFVTGQSQAVLTFVLGGARSGKSAHAEALVTALPAPWRYIATAQAFDDEALKMLGRNHDAAEVWSHYASRIERTATVPSGHYLQEECPDETYTELRNFFAV